MSKAVSITGMSAFLSACGFLLLGACSSGSSSMAHRGPASHNIKYQSMKDRDPSVRPHGILKPMKSTGRETKEFSFSSADQSAGTASTMSLAEMDAELFTKLTAFLGDITVERDIYYGREKIIKKGKYSWAGFLDLHREQILRVLSRDIRDIEQRLQTEPQQVIKEATEKLAEERVTEKTVVVAGNSVPVEDVLWTFVNGMQALNGMEITPRRRTIDEKPRFYTSYARDSSGKIHAKVFKSTRQLQ